MLAPDVLHKGMRRGSRQFTLLVRAAISAASLQTLAMSAPAKPGVSAAMRSAWQGWQARERRTLVGKTDSAAHPLGFASIGEG